MLPSFRGCVSNDHVYYTCTYAHTHTHNITHTYGPPLARLFSFFGKTERLYRTPLVLLAGFPLHPPSPFSFSPLPSSFGSSLSIQIACRGCFLHAYKTAQSSRISAKKCVFLLLLGVLYFIQSCMYLCVYVYVCACACACANLS